MGSTGSAGSVLAVVNLDVLHRLLGLDLGGLGRGERDGAEVGDAADYDDEQPGQGQPLVEESVSLCRGGNQRAV